MAEAELEQKTGTFGNEYAGKVQEIHEEYAVEIIDIGLYSESTCRVTIEGTHEAIQELLTVVDDPRNPPDEIPEG